MMKNQIFSDKSQWVMLTEAEVKEACLKWLADKHHIAPLPGYQVYITAMAYSHPLFARIEFSREGDAP